MLKDLEKRALLGKYTNKALFTGLCRVHKNTESNRKKLEKWTTSYCISKFFVIK